MHNRNTLLYSRIFNDTGDWFYYFVIVVIVYSLTKNAIVMGILAASYTLPGILFSNLLARTLENINDKPAQIIFDSLRVVMLVGLVLTRNITLVLIFVFLEQVLAIGSNLSFQRLTTDIVNGKKNFLAFNRDIKTFSNASRLLVIPLYLILHKIVSDRFILGLDIAFTLLSLVFTLRISHPTQQSGIFKKKNEVAIKHQASTVFHFNNHKLLKMVYVFSILTIVRAFVDAYGIMYINKTYTNFRVGYALLVFLMSLADLIGGLVSKKVILAAIKNRIHLILILSVTLVILFTGTTILHQSTFFIVSISLCRFILVLVELFVLYSIQENDPHKVHQYIATQTALTDGVALTDSFVGGPIIKLLGLYDYMFIINIVLIMTTCVTLWRSKVQSH